MICIFHIVRLCRSPLKLTIALTGSLGLLIACQSVPQSALQVNDELVPPEDVLPPQEITRLKRQQVPIINVLSSPPSSPLSSPQPAQQSPIVLGGTITQVAPLLTGIAYQLTDETGKIWVVSDRESPDLSSPLDQTFFWVTGIPRYQSIPAGGQEWGEAYFQEQARFPGHFPGH